MAVNKPLFITDKRRKISHGQLRLLMNYNAIELVFKRRIWPVKENRQRLYRPTPVRRILCTGNWKFLDDNKKIFNYKKPKRINGRPERYYRRRNLAITYDLIIKQFRIISLDDYRIINSHPLETDKDKQVFIDKYNEMFKRKGQRRLEQLLSK